MKCRYCGGDVTAKTVATTDNKLVVSVSCPKCGSYIDYSAPLVCNKCGKPLTGKICKNCGIEYYAENGVKNKEVKIATIDDYKKALSALVGSVVMQEPDTAIIEKSKTFARIVRMLYGD